jgi:hypothetical protein
MPKPDNEPQIDIKDGDGVVTISVSSGKPISNTSAASAGRFLAKEFDTKVVVSKLPDPPDKTKTQ